MRTFFARRTLVGQVSSLSSLSSHYGETMSQLRGGMDLHTLFISTDLNIEKILYIVFPSLGYGLRKKRRKRKNLSINDLGREEMREETRNKGGPLWATWTSPKTADGRNPAAGCGITAAG
ncbi:MAG: hypothetical protein ACPLPT_05555 [Moorellales bacterium]